MLITYDVGSNQDGGVANYCKNSNAIARAEQAYHDAIADHGIDSAEALVALTFLQRLRCQRLNSGNGAGEIRFKASRRPRSAAAGRNSHCDAQ